MFKHYKAVAYMCAYLSKLENECSQAMKHAVQDGIENKLPIYDLIKSIVHTYLNKRECRIQECLHHIQSGLRLRKTYLRVIFANSNEPEKQFRICLSEDKYFCCQIIQQIYLSGIC